MISFIRTVDELSQLINEKATILYQQLTQLPVDTMDLPDFAKYYYNARHIKRLYFSVETAAVLLYDSIKLSKKHWKDVVVMEYGAGMGSFYLLASLIGCKTIIYEDIDSQMVVGAQTVAQFLHIEIDHFIAGDHPETITYLKQHNIECDIIVSRNVVEHIYNLDDFYACMAAGQPNAILYFSTTANKYNLLMYLYHRYLHWKFEKQYVLEREAIIRSKYPTINDQEALVLSKATRGLAMQDLDNAIKNYYEHKILPNPQRFYTNTCIPSSGLWHENLINKSDYQRIIEGKGYEMLFLAAFWDTHYANGLKNLATKGLNVITKLLGKKWGIYTSPFVYIVAIPRQKNAK